uniref:Uncharacterized protein n=1 Tax=Steinernema glaseri TaxID=37863 RepID=A0A1I7ZJK1_9BILA
MYYLLWTCSETESLKYSQQNSPCWKPPSSLRFCLVILKDSHFRIRTRVFFLFADASCSTTNFYCKALKGSSCFSRAPYHHRSKYCVGTKALHSRHTSSKRVIHKKPHEPSLSSTFFAPFMLVRYRYRPRGERRPLGEDGKLEVGSEVVCQERLRGEWRLQLAAIQTPDLTTSMERTSPLDIHCRMWTPSKCGTTRRSSTTTAQRSSPPGRATSPSSFGRSRSALVSASPSPAVECILSSPTTTPQAI